MEKIIEVLKAVSDPTRLRVLMTMNNGEICVCQITELLNLAKSTISKHMSILRHAGLVKSRKDGKWIYYRHSTENQNLISKEVLNLLKAKLIKDKTIISDRKKLDKIISINKADLCSCKNCNK
ncbi:MAG TPA: metalloregulator ArsR/SmtB family transcription factor [Victivallales bacterium]|nr:metalloregulator ArsR/SmtB family transcription factor [Victivallales bacterium]